MRRINAQVKKQPTPASETPPVFLRVARVAALLDISRPSVYDLIRRGELLGVIRVGQRLRIPQSALDEMAKRRAIDKIA